MNNKVLHNIPDGLEKSFINWDRDKVILEQGHDVQSICKALNIECLMRLIVINPNCFRPWHRRFYAFVVNELSQRTLTDEQISVICEEWKLKRIYARDTLFNLMLGLKDRQRVKKILGTI